MMAAKPKAQSRSLARALFGAGALLVIACGAPAMAQSSCETDIGEFQKKRQVHMENITKLQKKGDGKLDPVAACPILRSLASTEQAMYAYMEKNQNWCNIPDQVLENVKEGSGKTAGVAKQACNIAAQVKKQQQQQAAGGGAGPFNTPAKPRLPAGPL